jgi:hypothetical protein
MISRINALNPSTKTPAKRPMRVPAKTPIVNQNGTDRNQKLATAPPTRPSTRKTRRVAAEELDQKTFQKAVPSSSVP